MRLGEYLKALRKERGLTLRDVAEKAKVSVSYISQIERGVSKARNALLLKRLSMIYGIPFDEIAEKAGYRELDDHRIFFEFIVKRAFDEATNDSRFVYGKKLPAELDLNVKLFIIEMHQFIMQITKDMKDELKSDGTISVQLVKRGRE